MNIKQPLYTFSALALAVVVGLSGPALAQSAAGSSPGAAAPSAASKAAQPQVDDKAAQEAEKKRAELTQDAITALTKTQDVEEERNDRQCQGGWPDGDEKGLEQHLQTADRPGGEARGGNDRGRGGCWGGGIGHGCTFGHFTVRLRGNSSDALDTTGGLMLMSDHSITLTE